MAFSAGYNGVIKLDATVGGSLTTYSTYFESFNFSLQTDAGEVSTFGDAWRDFIPTMKSLTFGGTYRSDPTFTAVVASHFNSQASGTTITFELDPDGTGSGTLKITGECMLLSWDPDVSVDGVSMGSVSYQSVGAVTVTAN